MSNEPIVERELVLEAADGVQLEAEARLPPQPWAAAVLAHPHPQWGGNMRSVVPGTLFAALPADGVAAIRFNFRGVGASTGTYGHGVAEHADVVAAVGALDALMPAGVPMILAGWSFGADVSLTVTAARIAGWLCFAPPLRVVDPTTMGAAHDPRPKRLVVPERDQFRRPEAVTALVREWVATEVETVAGADHYFIGRTERLAPATVTFLRSIARPTLSG